MIQEVKIATSRVGVLIGKGGATKKELEAKTHTTITIDSKEGLVKIEGSDENTIPLLRTVEIINAINCGFSPERAFEMIEDEDLLLDIIDPPALPTTRKNSTGCVAESSERTGGRASRSKI